MTNDDPPKKNKRYRRAVFFLHADIDKKLDRLRELIAYEMPIRCEVPIHSAVELAIDEAIARREQLVRLMKAKRDDA